MRVLGWVITAVLLVNCSSLFNFVLAEESLAGPFLIKISPPESEVDTRYAYKKRVLVAALDATVEEFGPYSIQSPPNPMTAARTFRELVSAGSSVNVTFALTSSERERIAIPVRIPIRKGLLNYRLLIVRSADLPDFMEISSLAELKLKVAGQSVGWVTSQILSANNFGVEVSQSREHLFPMLRDERFDYLLYGVNEAFKELSLRVGDDAEFAIVPNLALHVNVPLYFFVAPHQPLLAKRIEIGLESIIQNGVFDNLFAAAFGASVRQAALEKKQIFYIDNPSLSPLTPINRPELWFTPDLAQNVVP